MVGLVSRLLCIAAEEVAEANRPCAKAWAFT